MFRVSTTIVSPTATTTTIATSFAMSCQLLTVRKFGARIAKKIDRDTERDHDPELAQPETPRQRSPAA